MITLLIFLNTSVFFALSFLHFYWAVGGRWAFFNALPAYSDETKVFVPDTIACIIVATGLACLGILTLIVGHILPNTLPTFVEKYSMILIAILFFLRAIGDFRYSGFFKKVHGTQYAKMDTTYYSPLCLLLALSSIFIHVA
jgi:Protein of unknown function (DUF3995)